MSDTLRGLQANVPRLPGIVQEHDPVTALDTQQALSFPAAGSYQSPVLDVEGFTELSIDAWTTSGTGTLNVYVQRLPPQGGPAINVVSLTVNAGGAQAGATAGAGFGAMGWSDRIQVYVTAQGGAANGGYALYGRKRGDR